MSNIKLYCITLSQCVSLLNENALISTQGISDIAWRRYDIYGTELTVPIIALHTISHNDFMGFYA